MGTWLHLAPHKVWLHYITQFDKWMKLRNCIAEKPKIISSSSIYTTEFSNRQKIWSRSLVSAEQLACPAVSQLCPRSRKTLLPTSNGKTVRTSSSPPPGVIEIWDTLYSNLTVSRLENMPRTMYLHTQLNTIDITIKEDIFWTNCPIFW